MRYLNYLMGLMLAVALAACGGGGGNASGSSGTTPTTPTPAATVAAIEVLSSATTLGSASANTVTLTALLKSASNNGVAESPVTFSASSGVLQAVGTTTDANGTATATLSTGADRSNRDITVKVTSGSISKSIIVPVTGTTVSVAGAGSILLAGQTSYSVSVKDSGGAGISGASVTVASSLGNSVSPTTLTTDTTGAATFNYIANKSGAETLTVASVGASSGFAVAVSNIDFAFTTPAAGTEIFVNSPRVVTVRYLSGGVGAAGQTVNFSSTRGNVSAVSVVTDAQGLASTTLESSTAGPATVTAQIAGGAQTSLVLSFTAATPASIVLQINPGAIAANTVGSTVKRAVLSAVVKDASGNPVKGRTVNFTAVADASGGSINTGTGVTDANGTVTDFFISGAVPTAANGVVIRASVANTTITSDAALTVSNQALFITIATSNTISNQTETTYSKPFSVQVNDANGAAVANQTVTISVYPTAYRKGTLAFSDTDGAWGYGASGFLSCANEDINRDGILQPGEDVNGNGVLTPGIPGVVTPATVTTDSTGFVNFNLLYGEQFAKWVVFELTARATVAGTESKSVFSYLAEGAVSDFTNKNVPPAALQYPFGKNVSSCANPL